MEVTAPNCELLLFAVWEREQLTLRSLVNPGWISDADDVMCTSCGCTVGCGVVVGDVSAGPVGM